MFTGWSNRRGWLSRWCIALAGWIALAAHGAGTPAGTVIPNTAVLTYVYNGKAVTATAVAPVVTVAEVINVVLTGQDSSLVAVKAADTSKPLTFVLTNTGNGTETFRLSRNNALSGDSFDPLSAAVGALYLESGAAPGLQTSGPQADILYVPGTNDPTLAADASRILHLPSDIPAAIPQGATGNVSLEVRSTTPGAAGAKPGAGLAGLGDGGINAVVGDSRAQAAAVGGYVVSSMSLSVAKSVAAKRDPNGGVLIMPGTQLTYRIVLTLVGTGTAQNFSFADPLPATLSYVPGSLTVDGAVRSDADDSDNAKFAAGVVSAVFGDVAAPATRTIEFKATVN